jgi:hypothetical protein
MRPPDELWLLIILLLLILIVFYIILFVVDQPHNTPRHNHQRQRPSPRPQRQSPHGGRRENNTNKEINLVIERMARTERQVRQLGERISFSEKSGREERIDAVEREGQMDRDMIVLFLDLFRHELERIGESMDRLDARVGELVEYTTQRIGEVEADIEVLRRELNGEIDEGIERLDDRTEIMQFAINESIIPAIDHIHAYMDHEEEGLDVVYGLAEENRERLARLEGSCELLHGVIREGLEIVRDEDEMGVETWMEVLREIEEEVRRLANEEEGEEEEAKSNQDDEDEEHKDEEHIGPEESSKPKTDTGITT